MSLVLSNKIATKPSIAGNPRKYNVDAAKLAQGGAFATVDINLATLPKGTVFKTGRIKHNAAVTVSTGTQTTTTAQLFFNGVALAGGTLDVKAAPSNTGLVTDLTGSGAGSNVAGNILMMRVTITGGALLNAVNAGSIDAWIDYNVML